MRDPLRTAYASAYRSAELQVSGAVPFLMTDMAINWNHESSFKLDPNWPDYERNAEMKFTIENGVEIPAKRTWLKSEVSKAIEEALATLAVGQSFVATLEATGFTNTNSLSASINARAKALGLKVATRSEYKDDVKIGVRVWRLE